jgi:hypothetical protein
MLISGSEFTRKKWLTPLFVAFLVLIIYTATYTMSLSWDSLTYLTAVKAALENKDFQNLAHPHHLIYNIILYSFAKTMIFLGYRQEITFPVQLFSIFFAVSGILLFYLLLHKLTRSMFVSVFGSLGLAFSRIYWALSSQAEPYSLICALSILSLLIFALAFESGAKQSNNYSLALGGIMGVITLLQAACFLLFLSFLLYLFIFKKKMRFNLLLYSTVYFCIVFIAYALTYLIMGFSDLAKFIRWAMSYLFIDLGQGFIVSRYLKSFLYILSAIVRPRNLDKTFFMSAQVYKYAAIFAVCIAIYLSRFKVSWIKSLGSGLRKFSGLLILLSVWAIFFWAFFSWWAPQEIKFWAFLLIPLWTILSLLAAASEELYAQRRGSSFIIFRASCIICIIVLFLLNLSGIAFTHKPENNRFIQEAIGLEKHIDFEKDLLVTTTDFFEVYLQYRHSARGIISMLRALTVFEDDLNATWSYLARRIQETLSQGGRVYVSQNLFLQPLTPSELKDHGLRQEQVQDLILKLKKIGAFTQCDFSYEGLALYLLEAH